MFKSKKEKCIICKGTGVIKRMKPHKHKVCAVCKGTGSIET